MNMLVAMGLAAAACVLIGVLPGLLYGRLPHQPVDYHAYTLYHVTGTLGMLGFTALGFFLLLKHLDPEPKVSLDTDWFYRRGSSIVVTLTWKQVGMRLLLCLIFGLGWLIFTSGGLDQWLPGWRRLLRMLGGLSAGIGLIVLGDLVLGMLLARGRLLRLESGFVGEIYEFVMRRLVFSVSGVLREFDTRVVDSIAVGIGRLTQAFSQFLRTKVSGNAQHYGLFMAAGVLALLALVLFVL